MHEALFASDILFVTFTTMSLLSLKAQKKELRTYVQFERNSYLQHQCTLAIYGKSFTYYFGLK